MKDIFYPEIQSNGTLSIDERQVEFPEKAPTGPYAFNIWAALLVSLSPRLWENNILIVAIFSFYILARRCMINVNSNGGGNCENCCIQ